MVWYTPSKPRSVKNGIRARSRQGKMGSTWWSERWISTLESYGWENRLSRGRRYARMGQVIGFELSPGQVEAKVQGTMREPYNVNISVKTLTETQWEKVLEAIGTQALFTAKLLAGEMPQDIEGAFEPFKLTLFPSKKEISTRCSCPDYANPCKHTSAVFYILAEEFDRDPFMIFHLRGMSKEQMMEGLRAIWASQGGGEEPSSVNLDSVVDQNLEVEPQPIEDSIHSFWSPRKPLDQFRVTLTEPHVDAAVIKRLGEPPTWRETEDFVTLMEKVYRTVTRKSMKTAFNSLA